MDNKVKDLVSSHHRLVGLLMVAAVVVVVYLLWERGTFKMGESYADANPAKKYSHFGFSGTENYMKERAESGKSSAEMAAKGGAVFKSLTYDPRADPNNVNSLNYQILNSDEFSCATRQAVSDDPWGWMVATANEPEKMSNMDAKLSAIAAGEINK
jgi:hypothetical protein